MLIKLRNAKKKIDYISFLRAPEGLKYSGLMTKLTAFNLDERLTIADLQRRIDE